MKKSVNQNKSQRNDVDIFNDYFENMDLDVDMQSLYDLMDDPRLTDEYEKRKKLNKLRTENHRRYHNIRISKLENLTYDFNYIIRDTLNLYRAIDSKRLLAHTYDKAENTKVVLDKIYRNLNRLDRIVKNTLKDLIKRNDELEEKLSLDYFNTFDLTSTDKKLLTIIYNKLLLIDPIVSGDAYDNLSIQMKRNKYITDIFKILNIDIKDICISEGEILKDINEKINKKIIEYNDKIRYLQDLIQENSKYSDNFNKFINYFNSMIAYDDTNYDSTNNVYEFLYNDDNLNLSIKKYEELFIDEREKNRKEENFIYEKFGIKNLKSSLDCIKKYYFDNLDDDSKNVIIHISNKIESGKYNLEQIETAFGVIVKDIWKKTITDVYYYNPKEDYCFLCSNNQFIDTKYQTILITKKVLNMVDNYYDYQIGFICSYNDNLLYMTDNEDINTVNYNDLSNLKTPIQVEQEFVNYGICNRIALDGSKTTFDAVYYINDGNKEKYIQAMKLANTYKLPLLVLEKDN